MFFSWLSGLKCAFAQGKTKQRLRRKLRSRVRIEELESRLLLTAYLVNITGDSSASTAGTGSGTSGDLRYCFNLAASDFDADTISFDTTVFSSDVLKTIELDELLTTKGTSVVDAYGQTSFIVGLADSITIDGSLGNNVPGITLDGGGLTRLFAVVGGGELQLNNLTLTGGKATGGVGGVGNTGGAGGAGAGLGGAVFVDGTGTSFTANGVTFVNNQAVGGVGGSTIAGAGQAGAGGGGLGAPGGAVAGNVGGAGGGINGGAGGARVVPGQAGGVGGGGGGGGEGANGTAIGRPGGEGGLGGGGGGGGNFSHGALGGFGGGGGGGGGGKGSSLGGSGGFGGGGGGTGASGGNGGGGGGGAGLGGAIFSNGGTLTLINNTFIQNTAIGGAGGTGGNAGSAGRGLGGAVFVRNGTLDATFVTFTSNTAAQGGTDAFVLSDGTGNQAIATFKNSILGQDASTTVTDFFATTNADGTAPDSSASANNLVTLNGTGANGLAAGALVPGTAPNFVAGGLADNGGSTKTIALTAASTGALQTGVAGTGITTDQRGVMRSSLPDLGAFQFTIVTPTITAVSPNLGINTGGTAITITGTGFQSGATVTIDGVAATGIVVVDDTTITATTPAGTSGAADVVVTNADTGTVTSSGGFTYISAPTDISLSSSTLPENAGPAAAIGTFNTVDSDIGDSYTYTLVGGAGATDNALFQITGNELQAIGSFDFEAGTTYSIRVQSTDSYNLTVEDIFTITITNVNEAPTAILLSSNAVAENQPSGTTVGTFTTTDPDAADTFTYTLITGVGSADNGSFTIDANGNLLTAASFDFETQSTYSIRVRSMDAGGLTTDDVFTINVTDVPDASPVIKSSAVANIAENSPTTTVVIDVNATDTDLPAQTLTYSLSGFDAALFNIDSDTGEITFITSPDYELPADQGQNNVYNLTVTVTDDGSPSRSTSQDLTVTVMPVNDNTPVYQDASPTFTIPENSANGTAVGSLTATDADLPAQSLSYSIISGNESGAFAINPSTGQITVADSSLLNYDETTSYSLGVRVTDNTEVARTADAMVVVNITDVAAGPRITIPRPTGTYHVGRYPGPISPDATFTYEGVANPNFENAILTVSIVSGRSKQDKLSIFGSAKNDALYTKGSRVFFDGVQIGKVKGGRGRQPDLTVTLNSQATTTAVTSLLQHLSFSTKTDVGVNRTIQLQLTGVSGADSEIATRTLEVVP